IFWGTRVNLRNESWMAGDAPVADLLESLRSGYTGLRVPVPYTTTLYVRDLMNPRAETRAIADQQARALLENRFVLYGANLSGVNDLIVTPTRQILPGVYLHAMALDNLLHWGPNYKSANGTLWTAHAWWHQVWSLLIVLPIALIYAYLDNAPRAARCRLNKKRWRRKWLSRLQRHPAITSALVALSMAVWFLLWSIFEFRYFNVSVSTLAGYLGFIGLGFFLERLKLLDWVTAHAITPCLQWLKARRNRLDA